MFDTPGAILRQLARTALLVVALGLLLYGVVFLVASSGVGPWLIGLVLAGPLAVLQTLLVAGALRSGVFPEKTRAPTRAERPVAYWTSIAWYGTAALAMGGLAAWCALELLKAALRGA
jgi:hypothetical protein